MPVPRWSRVFCSEWNLVEPSPEADYCVVPKDTPIRSLEAVGSELLKNCQDLLDDDSIHRGSELVPIVPVIVTNAWRKVCRLDGSMVPLDSGKIGSGDGRFADVDLVRFRKSLANQRSNSYDDNPLRLPDWILDRERTVFVARPRRWDVCFMGFGCSPPLSPAACRLLLRTRRVCGPMCSVPKLSVFSTSYISPTFFLSLQVNGRSEESRCSAAPVRAQVTAPRGGGSFPSGCAHAWRYPERPFTRRTPVRSVRA